MSLYDDLYQEYSSYNPYSEDNGFEDPIEQENQPWYSQTSALAGPQDGPVVAPERGFLSDYWTSVKRSGVNLATGAVKAAETFSGKQFEADESMQAWSDRELAPDISEYRGDENFLKRTSRMAIEQTIPSLAPTVVGGVVGTLTAGPAGGIAGGMMLSAAFHGGQEKQLALERGRQEGLEGEELERYANTQAYWVAAGESVASAVDIFTAGQSRVLTTGLKAARGVVKGEAKDSVTELLKRGPAAFAKDYSQMASSEVLTELAQNEMSAKIDRDYGLEGDVTWAERGETVAVSMWMSAFFASGSQVMNVGERTKLKSDLQSEDTNKREAAANKLHGLLKQQDPEIASSFRTVWNDAENKETRWQMDAPIVQKVQEIQSEVGTPAPEGGVRASETNRDAKALVDVPAEQAGEAVDRVLSKGGVDVQPVDTIEENLPMSEEIAATQGPGFHERAEAEAQGEPALDQEFTPQELKEGQTNAKVDQLGEMGAPASVQQRRDIAPAPTAANVNPPTTERGERTVGDITRGNAAPETQRRVPVRPVPAIEVAEARGQVAPEPVRSTALDKAPVDEATAMNDLASGKTNTQSVRGLIKGLVEDRRAVQVASKNAGQDIGEMTDTFLEGKAPEFAESGRAQEQQAVLETLYETVNQIEDPNARAIAQGNINEAVERYFGPDEPAPPRPVNRKDLTWTDEGEGVYMAEDTKGVKGKEGAWVVKGSKGNFYGYLPGAYKNFEQGKVGTGITAMPVTEVTSRGIVGPYTTAKDAQRAVSGGRGEFKGTPAQQKEAIAQIREFTKARKKGAYSFVPKGKSRYEIQQNGKPLAKVGTFRTKAHAQQWLRLKNEGIGGLTAHRAAINAFMKSPEAKAYADKVLAEKPKEPTVTQKVKAKAPEKPKAKAPEKPKAKAPTVTERVKAKATKPKTLTRRKAKGETKVDAIEAQIRKVEGMVEKAEVPEYSDTKVKETPRPTDGVLNIATNFKRKHKKMISVYEGFLRNFGITSPDIVVIGKKGAADLVTQLENQGREGEPIYRFAKKAMVTQAFGSTVYSPIDNEIFLIINEDLLDIKGTTGGVETMLHESGHIVERLMFHQADQKTKDAIIQEYQDFVKREIVDKGVEGPIPYINILQALKSRASGRKYATMVGGTTFGPQNLKHFSYATSFEEWFADQVALWATTNEKPVGIVEQFFKGVADVMKSLFNAVRGGDINETSGPEMTKWLNGIYEQGTADPVDGTVSGTVRVAENDAITRHDRDTLVWDMPLYKKMQEDAVTAKAANAAQEQSLSDQADVMLDDEDRPLLGQTAEDITKRAQLGARGITVAETTKERYGVFDGLNTKKAKFDRLQQKLGSTIAKSWKKAFRSGIDIITDKAPELAGAVKKFLHKMETQKAKDMKSIITFGEAYKKLTDNEKMDVTQVLFNGDKESLDKLFKRIPEIQKPVEDARKVIDRLAKKAKDSGLDIDGEMQENYWPRLVSNQEGLQQLLQGDDKVWNKIKEEFKVAAKAQGLKGDQEITQAEKEEIIGTIMRTGRYPGMIRRPDATKERVIESVTSHMVPHYENAFDSVVNYVESMSEAIAIADFIGSTPARRERVTQMKKAFRDSNKTSGTEASRQAAYKNYLSIREELRSADGDLFEGSLQNLMVKYAGDMNANEMAEVTSIVRSRLLQKGMSGLMGDLRNVGLMTTLTDITSLVTQMQEIVLSIYDAGLVNTIRGFGKALTNKSFVNASDLGLKQVLTEYQKQGTSKWVSWLLESTRFMKVDLTMKEAFMNAQILKSQKLVGKPQLKENFGHLFTDAEFVQFEKDLKSSNPGASELVSLMAYARLMDFQPTDVIANPEFYGTAGNARILYMLKTFQIRQFNMIYNETFKKIISGDKKQAIEGTKNLVKLGTLLVLAGVGKDELRDFLLGRDTPVEDEVQNALLGLVLFSRYDIQQLQRDGLGATLLGMAVPPTPLFDELPKDVMNLFSDDPTFKTVSMMPYAGRVAYSRLFEGGREAAANRSKRSFGKQIEKAVVSGNTGDLRGIRADIRKFNEGKTGDERITTSYVSRKISAARKKKREEARN